MPRSLCPLNGVIRVAAGGGVRQRPGSCAVGPNIHRWVWARRYLRKSTASEKHCSRPPTPSRRFTSPDRADDREQAPIADAQVILGDDELESIACACLAAWRIEREPRAAFTGALIAPPGSEVSLADRVGATRMTVRNALGK